MKLRALAAAGLALLLLVQPASADISLNFGSIKTFDSVVLGNLERLDFKVEADGSSKCFKGTPRIEVGLLLPAVQLIARQSAQGQAQGHGFLVDGTGKIPGTIRGFTLAPGSPSLLKVWTGSDGKVRRQYELSLPFRTWGGEASARTRPGRARTISGFFDIIYTQIFADGFESGNLSLRSLRCGK